MDDTIRKIAVCTDFTSIAQHSFDESLRFAKTINAEVHLVHILNDEKETVVTAEQRMIDVVKQAGDLSKGVDIKFVVAEDGNVVDRINEEVNKIDPDYFVVGYQLKKGMDRFFGPNIIKIVQGTKYPVIAIKEDETLDDMKKVLFPLNLNDFARQKTVHTMRLALDLGATIHLVGLAVDFTQNDNKKLKVYLNQIKEQFEKYKIPYVSEWLEGDDETNLAVDYANVNDIDIIAKVFDHNTSLIDMITGSSEDDIILAKTNIPLYIVKSHEFTVGSWSTMRG